jgi:hypothetical protein
MKFLIFLTLVPCRSVCGDLTAFNNILIWGKFFLSVTRPKRR